MFQTTNPRNLPRPVISESPSAHKPHGKHAPLSVLAEYQGGRVRTWLENNTGIACVAIGWLFAFATIAIVPELEAPIPDDFYTAIVLLCFAIALISFGVGWMYRNESGQK